jgi:hypothetical protein
MKRLQLVSHLIQAIHVCDVEMLSDLLGPLLYHPLKVQLSFSAIRNLALQELSQAFDMYKQILVPLNLILSLLLGVFYDSRLELLIVVFEVLQGTGDLDCGRGCSTDGTTKVGHAEG